MKRAHFYGMAILPGILFAGCGNGAQQKVEPVVVVSPDVQQAPPEQVNPAEVDPATSAAEEVASSSGVRTFIIDASSSQASYSVGEEFFEGNTVGKQAGLFDTVGSTSDVEGQIAFTLQDGALALGENQFTVNLQSLTSDEPRRDNRIRERWLESNRYPLATFTAIDANNFPTAYQEGQPVSFELTGNLTIREITKEVTFRVEATLNGSTLSGIMTTTILMTDFGFDPPVLLGVLKVDNEVLVTVMFTALEVQ